jgi:hypothetical protein
MNKNRFSRFLPRFIIQILYVPFMLIITEATSYSNINNNMYGKKTNTEPVSLFLQTKYNRTDKLKINIDIIVTKIELIHYYILNGPQTGGQG